MDWRLPDPTPLRLALGMICFGSATPVGKIVGGAMPVFVGSALRVGLGALVLLPFALRHWRQVRDFSRRDWLLIGLIALFGMFGFSALMLYGMQMASGVTGAVVMSTTPAVTAGASILFLKERATWRKLTAILLAVAGVAILHAGGAQPEGGSGNGLFGPVLVFGAVCCEAAYTLLGKKAAARADPILVAFLAALLSLPAFLPFAAWQWHEFAPAQTSTGDWAAIIWYGAGTLALGSWLWYSGIARAEGTLAAGFMGLMPVSALVLSYVLLGEPFRWLQLPGFATVLAGVLLVAREHGG